MKTETLIGTVLDVSAPFYVGVPESPAAYEVLVILFKPDDEQPRTLFTASHLCSGFDREFTTLLFSKGKRMQIKITIDTCMEFLNGLGANIVSAFNID